MSINRFSHNYKTHNSLPQYFELHCVNPVSYTHLDVYKRQPYIFPIISVLVFGFVWFGSLVFGILVFGFGLHTSFLLTFPPLSYTFD